ncbi:MAG: cytochrome c [Anaerolineae bacterium]
MTRRILITLVILVTPFILGLAVTYEVIQVDFRSFMEDQPSITYQEGPRHLPGEGALPFFPEVRPETAGAVPINPVPADEVSLQRGALLYNLHCALCHGEQGAGDGPITQRWKEDAPSQPADLREDRIVSQPDGALYLTLTQGFGAMTALSENLTLRERWDVINFVRSLRPPQAQ